ncbi:unnamed protein product [Darwinula stevensoni]|uniref:Uncharacterized protein n=1 Tax=Darwinula stevensoni TaxID=69355 RepID=A0A7R9FT27_9CRUS|nr:unnamed protein product [Darwinula stevensoni]CAG0903801.1 unnamed protein product [Darwinula stevensoni]
MTPNPVNTIYDGLSLRTANDGSTIFASRLKRTRPAPCPVRAVGEMGVGSSVVTSYGVEVTLWKNHIRREHSYCRILDDEEDECIEALDVVETILPLDESMDLAYSWSSSLKMSPGGSPEMPLGSPESYILPD